MQCAQNVTCPPGPLAKRAILAIHTLLRRGTYAQRAFAVCRLSVGYRGGAVMLAPRERWYSIPTSAKQYDFAQDMVLLVLLVCI